jgi:hypothetical protein
VLSRELDSWIEKKSLGKRHLREVMAAAVSDYTGTDIRWKAI